MITPKYILFDFGGTLAQPNFDRDRWISHWLSLSHNPRGATLEQVRDAGDELLFDAFEADIRPDQIEFTRTQFERHLCARFGLSFDLTHEEVELDYIRIGYHSTLKPGVANALKLIETLKIPMGVVSNSVLMGVTLMAVFRDLNIGHHFNFVMSSADYGFRKPHPQIFKTALAKTGCVAGDVWFVGDRLDKDIAGAQELGMVGVWYNPEGDVAEGVQPDLQITHWDELAERLNHI